MKCKVPVRIVPLVLSGLLGFSFGNVKKNNNVNKESKLNDKSYMLEIPDEKVKTNLPFVLNNNEQDLELLRYVMALKNINIYKDENLKEKISLFIKGNTLLLLNEFDNVYEIKYDGNSYYISKDNTEIIYSYENPYEESILTLNTIEDIKQLLEEIDVITATATVNVREKATTKSKKLSQLNKGETLPYINETDEWYEVNYYGKSAYVYKKYAKKDINYYTKIEMVDMVYATSKIILYDITTNEEIFSIPKHEVAEVYAKKDDYYLVKCKGKIGYVNKDNVCSLGDDYVIIDISSQNLKVYVNDKLIVDTSIVTGKDSSPTYCGLFSVREKKTNVRWKEFKVTVKYWMPFNRSEGMHDADWRSEFGGNIYHKKGSHGCVNIPPKVMPKIYKNIDVGVPVLVKK